MQKKFDHPKSVVADDDADEVDDEGDDSMQCEARTSAVIFEEVKQLEGQEKFLLSTIGNPSAPASVVQHDMNGLEL